MKIQLERKNAHFHFEGKNESGNVLNMDANPSIGGEGKGVRPMEMLLMALGGCSGIDVVSILRKQKQEVRSFSISVDGEREAGKEPSLFRIIHVVFTLGGELDPVKVKRAVELSMEKYCSVGKTLEATAKITYEICLNGNRI